MLSPGNVVERYEVERELGGGGMARVYKVRHVALGSVHALKVLDPELVGNAELRARFLDEGRIQARLRHPNILVITDVVVAPGVAGLVMDYLEGESLDKYLANVKQPPSPDEVRDIFRQVLAAMEFAHQHGVIHRDLKPSNIFLEQVHGRRVVRVLDFGIAKVSDKLSDAEGRPVARPGSRMGTPQYMSPEQIRSAEEVTVRSDIFSLGVTLYELATAQPCFQGESDAAIMEKIVRGEFVSPDVVHPGLAPGLRTAILRAMALEPERRFASCGEFAAALVEEAPAPVRAATPLRVPVTRAPVAAPRVREPEPDGNEPTFVPRPAPVQAPAARVVEARPAPVRLAEPKPAAPLEKRAPKLAKKPAPPPSEEAEAEQEEAPPRGKPWRWVLLFALAGLVALFGSALIGMLSGGSAPSAPKGGAPVTRPGGSPGTRSR
ncbi:serine/threonine-protein kinase [Archangium gephyra]|uniref:Serine/threonine protein kinase PrkC, regulator of stationary phase n=1 Tax=Archangium gephyra TaxID=48 RepID=A0AAC8TIS0_9BACT|nr:serine/threonine-protein kinase [Archangium gephyra]AKJ05896.1 Serine/threonine protein kinase PrkC, regulator of stationary phase [Archangium gephyra]REG27350.1 serine/threonine-protein kinase [Archangium gephyra]